MSRCLVKLIVLLDQHGGLTLHDLLQLHLQGLDGAGGVVPRGALDPVDGQPPLVHRCHVVVFQEDHPVGVLDDRTAMGERDGDGDGRGG